MFDDALLDQKIIPPPKEFKETNILKSVIKKEARGGDRNASPSRHDSRKASANKHT